MYVEGLVAGAATSNRPACSETASDARTSRRPPLLPGTSIGFDLSRVRWLNQSCVWNWIHAAARRLRVVAGMNSRRPSTERLTSRGSGTRIWSAPSGQVSSIGTLRPNTVPLAPMRLSLTSLPVPSRVRSADTDPAPWGSGSSGRGWCRLASWRRSRTPISVANPSGTGRWSHPTRWSTTSVARPYHRRNSPATIGAPINASHPSPPNHSPVGDPHVMILGRRERGQGRA